MGKSNLKSIIKSLFNHQKLIILFTVIATIIAFVLNFFVLKPVYRGAASIYLAQINNNLLLKANDVKSLIAGDAFLQKLSSDIGIPSEAINSSISLNVSQDSKILIVSFDNGDKELIKSFFRNLIIELNNFNNEAFQNQIKPNQLQIDALTNEYNSLKGQEKQLLKQLSGLEQKSQSDANYLLEYSQMRGIYDSVVQKEIDLLQQINNLKAIIGNSNVFIYQSEPQILDSPVKPRKVFNVAVTLLIALLTSSFIAIFMDYWKES